MVTPATAEAEPAPARTAKRRGGARLVGWALLACWSVLLVCAVFLGEGASTLDRLEADVATGRVDAVRIEGGPPVRRGFAVVEVHWRSGVLAYTTQVVEARPVEAGRRAGARDGVTGVVSGDLGDTLRRLQPGLRVERVDYQSGPSTQVLGRELTGWVALVLIVVFLSTLVLLILGPEPWRATRWAWFWLLTSAVAPLAAVAYLLLAGPTSLVRAPRQGSRRLTGGWAFLIASVVTTAVRVDR